MKIKCVYVCAAYTLCVCVKKQKPKENTKKRQNEFWMVNDNRTSCKHNLSVGCSIFAAV